MPGTLDGGQVAPKVYLILCATTASSEWVGRGISEGVSRPRAVAKTIVVARGPAPQGVAVEWIQVPANASLGAMKRAGYQAADEADVVWFEVEPGLINWAELESLSAMGVANPRDPIDWEAQLVARGVAAPSEPRP